ncbi:MAG TPA: RNA polymerase sigma factor [Streptosporangiaceae bacterium]|nr:RNA polymerase sigma factor [Streptosporangiaceae bacterium]
MAMGGPDEWCMLVIGLALQDVRMGVWMVARAPRPAAEAADPQARIDAQHVEFSRTDPDRFGAIFDEYFATIHGYVARRLGADVADDLAAETFVTAFRKRAQFDASRGTVRAWLYGIATKELSRHRRGEIRLLQALARSVPAPSYEGPEDDLVADRVTAQAWASRLARAIAELSPGDRDVLLLVALGGLRHDEVSAALGIPYGTVGSRLNRVRQKLRAELGTGPTDFADNGSHGAGADQDG